MKKNKKPPSLFQSFSTKAAEVTGSAGAFLLAFLVIIVWLLSGPFFKFSDTWQLIINTGTSVAAFLMVFLIQHTQNRDTKILNLKMDELIKSHTKADNLSIDLDKLNDEELKMIEAQYKKLCQKKESSRASEK